MRKYTNILLLDIISKHLCSNVNRVMQGNGFGKHFTDISMVK